jgi:D-alanyl-D-alanine carboxypeptidase (penicillin-binding protein 5/6)
MAWFLAFNLVLLPAHEVWAEPGSAAADANRKPPEVWLNAEAAILMDWKTGTIIYEKNAFQRRHPASTTKVLTAIVALEQGNLEDLVTVSRQAAYTEGSSMGIGPGQVYRLEELIWGLLLRSGNDAGVAIAEHIGGSVEGFAALMNQKAREIGAFSTTFRNPHGLTEPGHLTTAYDLALITKYARLNRRFAEMVATRQKTLGSDGRGLALYNTNQLLWMFEGADGVKTGTTSAAGACLVSSATRRNWRLVGVVLGSYRGSGRYDDTSRLLQWGFESFSLVDLATEGQVLMNVPVIGGMKASVGMRALRDISVVVPRGDGAKASIEILRESAVKAPISEGQVLGTALVWHDNQIKGQVYLVASSDVSERTWLRQFLKNFLPILYRVRDWGLG